jgi:hypothetical protein
MHESINIRVDLTDIERFEAVPVERLPDGTFLLLGSPGFAGGFAAGDRVKKSSRDPEDFEIVERGGNVSVQVFLRSGKHEALEYFHQQFRGICRCVDGGLDGKNSGHLIILTIPVRVGFQAIQRMLAEIPAIVALDSWMYGNVYDQNGAPLNWWL